MINKFKANRKIKQGDILGALALSEFKKPSILARAQLYISLLENRSSSPFLQALAFAQLGQTSDSITILKKLDLHKLSCQPIQFRLPLIQKIALNSYSQAAEIARELTPEKQDLIQLLLKQPAQHCPLLQVNQLLNRDLQTAEVIWSKYFLDNKLTAPNFPNDKNKLELKLLNHPPLPKVDGPLVSIIVSAYNAKDHLATSVSSLLSQSWKNTEIIVIDDASTDGTFQIATNLLGEFPQHKVVRQTINQGTYIARNNAIEMCSGDFIMNHDADDWAHPSKIQRQISFLNQANVVATTSRWMKIGDQSGNIESNYLYPLTRYCTNSIMFKRSVLENIKGYDPVRVAADERFEMEIRSIFGPKSILHCKQPLTIGNHSDYTLTGNSIEGITDTSGLKKRVLYRESWMPQLVEQYKSFND